MAVLTQFQIQGDPDKLLAFKREHLEGPGGGCALAPTEWQANEILQRETSS